MALDEVLGRLGPTATTVLIDGRSGSGKSTLALQLRENWADSVVVRLDDIYPGWDGLSWAADHVQQSLLQPRAAGVTGHWRQWDWAACAPKGLHPVESGQRLILEGVGALTPATGRWPIWASGSTPMTPSASAGHWTATARPTGRTGTGGPPRRTSSSRDTGRGNAPI
ncbi:Para-aminobenzoate synthase [Mycolicibacterium fortuitum]|uniref:Para-aminobenzoate synthase n=1 Tax=Mycolicibacterium fortuitum TaxID=1766 RepID=A0A378V260_MYCFO|nr:Para-aminobenzoate synthase [Mycolicibacterium fortuitum]